MRMTIDDSGAIHTLINTFEVSAQRQLAVVASLRRFTEQHARRMHGFVGAAVHASIDGARVVNYVQWASRDDLQAMLKTAAAVQHMAEVGALADRVIPVFYSVAYVGSGFDEVH